MKCVCLNSCRLRDETKKLMEEKEVYQDTAKQTLKKLVDEKLEAVNKQKELEKALSNIEDEYASLKELHDKDVAQNRELAVQVRTFLPSFFTCQAQCRTY